MTHNWQYILRIIVQVIIPWIFLNAHHLFPLVLYVSFVYVTCESLELRAKSPHERLDKYTLV